MGDSEYRPKRLVGPPPPKTALPEGAANAVDVVKKKLAPPKGAPPVMGDFKMPKHLSPVKKPAARGERGDKYTASDDDDEPSHHRKEGYNGVEGAESSYAYESRSKSSILRKSKYDEGVDDEDSYRPSRYVKKYGDTNGDFENNNNNNNQIVNTKSKYGSKSSNRYGEDEVDSRDGYGDERVHGGDHDDYIDDHNNKEGYTDENYEDDYNRNDTRQKVIGRNDAVEKTEEEPTLPPSIFRGITDANSAVKGGEEGKIIPREQLPNAKLHAFNFHPILKATYKVLKNFAMSSCPPGQVIKCYIERNRTGKNYFSPFYSLCADLEDGTGRELIVCRKVVASRSAHYVFSLKLADLYLKREERSQLYLGKLRRITPTDYILYDGATSGEGSNQRLSEMLAVHYNIKTRPAPTGVRGCEVGISNIFTDETETADTETSGGGRPHVMLQDSFSRVRAAGKQNELLSNKVYVMHERTSKYDPLSSCLVDFKGRANVASVKNFQIIKSTPQDSTVPQSPDSEKDWLLQMGKTTEDCFNMDFKQPLSLLQAFAVCVTRFDMGLSFSS